MSATRPSCISRCCAGRIDHDVCLLKHSSHDWYDEKSVVIRSAIRKKSPTRAAPLLTEAVVWELL